MILFPLLFALPVVADEAAPFEPALEIDPTLLQEEAAEEGPDGKWTGAFTIGANLTSGNTDVTNASATADATSETDADRWTLGFNWAYASEDTSGVTQRRTSARAQYDRFIDDKSYEYANVSVTNDLAALLDLRSTLGVGYGREFADTDKWKIKGEVGVSYVDEDFVTDDDASFMAARFAYSIDWLLSETWTFGQTGEVFPSLDDTDDVHSRTDTRAKAKLTENMFGQFQWVWDWDNTPATDKESSDHLYLITIGWAF